MYIHIYQYLKRVLLRRRCVLEERGGPCFLYGEAYAPERSVERKKWAEYGWKLALVRRGYNAWRPTVKNSQGISTGLDVARNELLHSVQISFVHTGLDLLKTSISAAEELPHDPFCHNSSRSGEGNLVCPPM